MKSKLILVFLILMVEFVSSCVSYAGYKSVIVEVVDEDDQKVEGARVSVSFDGGGGDVKSFSKLTNSRGTASFEGKTPYTVPVSVVKAGYYFSRLLLDNTAEAKVTRKVLLRKKKDPRPMHAKSERFQFPELDKDIGFDFYVGDWVRPHGKGLISDVYFRAITNLVDRNNYSFAIKVSFPNEGDGVVLLEESQMEYDSVFKFPYLAPDAGYVNMANYRVEKKEGVLIKNLPIAVFRTRSVFVGGKLDQANYTKLYPPITPFGLAKSPGLDLTYYFNPLENNRSLEFDTEMNLYLGENYPGRRFYP